MRRSSHFLLIFRTVPGCEVWYEYEFSFCGELVFIVSHFVLLCDEIVFVFLLFHISFTILIVEFNIDSLDIIMFCVQCVA